MIATKQNYSNTRQRLVVLTLTQNRTALHYETRTVQGCMPTLRKKARSVPLEAFVALVNGGTTSAFCYRKFKPKDNKFTEGKIKAQMSQSLILNSMAKSDDSRGESLQFCSSNTTEVRYLPWECVSIVRKDFSTLDFILSKRSDLMALISVLGYHIYGQDVHKVLIS